MNSYSCEGGHIRGQLSACVCYKVSNQCFDMRVFFLPQECPFKVPQLWSGRHAFLHHHRGKRADPHFTLYLSE